MNTVNIDLFIANSALQVFQVAFMFIRVYIATIWTFKITYDGIIMYKWPPAYTKIEEVAITDEGIYFAWL